MPRKYSNRTLDALAHYVEWTFSHSEMDSLFFAVSVPDHLDHGSNKLQRGLNVLRSLAAGEVPNGPRLLDEVVDEVIQRRKSRLRSVHGEDREAALLRALAADGYEVVSGVLHPSDSLEQEVAHETSILERRLRRSGLEHVQRTLEQAHENFVDGNYEACNAMLRTSLEATLEGAATRLAGERDSIPRRGKHLQPADIRRYLRNEGFFSEDEFQYVSALYGTISPRGSHPGLSDETESRLRRLVVVAMIQYCMEKLVGRE